MATSGVSGALRYLNDPQRLRSDNGFEGTALKVGARADQPGAALLTAWYQRNFKICASITRPADREIGWWSSTSLATPSS